MATALHRQLGLCFQGVVDLIYPPACFLCDNWETAPKHRSFCETCLQKIAEAARPAIFVLEGENTCEHCLSAWPYDGMMDKLIPEMKYKNRPSFAHLLGEMAAGHLQEFAFRQISFLNESGDAPMLIPVPLHSRRQRERGFNQSLEIARALGRVWKLQVAPKALRRIRFTAPQVRLGAEERANNVAGAFAVRSAVIVQGRTIILADDVITTGSTIHACAKALKEAGARAVMAVSLAKA